MNTDETPKIGPQHFLDRRGRRVLTYTGAPGLDGIPGNGSPTETALASIAAAINIHAHQLDDAQLDNIIRWVNMYKRKDRQLATGEQFSTLPPSRSASKAEE